MSDMETCGNCGHRIGKLEEAHFWKEHVVCTACKDVLTRQAKAKSNGSSSASHAARARTGAPAGASSSSPAASRSASASGAAIKLNPLPGEVELRMKPDDDVVAPAAEAFPEPDDADVPPIAHPPKRSRPHRAAPATYPCAQCGTACAANEVTDVDGQLLCESCAMFIAPAEQSATVGQVYGGAKSKSALPPWLPLAIAGTVLGVVIIVSAIFMVHGGSDAEDESAAPPPVRRPAVAPGPVEQSAMAVPAAPAKDDATEAQKKLLDAMLAASELEAAGRNEEALEHYRRIADALAAPGGKSESRAKTLSRAQAAVARLTAATAQGASKPDSIFDETVAPAAVPVPVARPAVPAAVAKPAELPRATPAVVGDGFDDGGSPEAAANELEDEVVAGRPSTAKPALAAAGTAQSPTVGGATTKPAARGIDLHLEAGKAALASSDYPAAMKAFKDALDFDKKNPHALHGVGLSHYYLNEQSKSIETLEKAVVAGANRAIVYNLGVVHMKANPMRAAKYVRDYLAKPGVPLDEPLQNMLGAALDAAGATPAKNGQTFSDLRRFYFQYDARLAEARKDGTRRWGIHWIPAAQADSKWQTSQARVQEADRTDTEYGRAKIKTKKAEEKLNDLNRSFGLVPERKYVEARQGIKSALLYEADTRKRRDAAQKALAGTEMPEFPKYLQFIPIDALTVQQHPQT